MKKQIIIAAMLAATGLAGAQMFAQLFGATGTPIQAVAWYKLDGNALDSSGNGYHGTWAGTAVYSNGVSGTQSACFRGAERIDTTAKILGTGDITYCAWVRISTHQSAYVFNQSNITGMGRIMFFNAPSYVRIQFGTTTREQNVAAGTWMHAALVRKDGQARVYFDGQQAGDVYENANLLPDVVAQIGGTDRIANRNSISCVDDVRMFNRALSPANIARIMESQDNEPLEELQ